MSNIETDVVSIEWWNQLPRLQSYFHERNKLSRSSTDDRHPLAARPNTRSHSARARSSRRHIPPEPVLTGKEVSIFIAPPVVLTSLMVQIPPPRELSPEPALPPPGDWVRPCPTCTPGNRWGYNCPQPIPEPNGETGWQRENGDPPGHTFCGHWCVLSDA